MTKSPTTPIREKREEYIKRTEEYGCRMCKWNSKIPYPRRFKIKNHIVDHLKEYHRAKNWPSMIKILPLPVKGKK